MKKTLLFISIFLLLIFTGSIHSSGVPEEPMLRMEMGMHSAWITCIAVDPKNRFIVTGSQDKTLRLWELSTGRLIKIFRPPIGEDPIGMISDVAFSPDGKTIACGGETKSEKEESYFVYFFDRESGKLVQRIGGLAESIRRLAYSKDGRFLAIGFGKTGGIRVHRISDYFVAGEDENYGDWIYGVDFDFEGKLVTVFADGFIRLYGSDFKLITKKKAPDGFRPISARFSPDGSNIAVTFYDPPYINTKLDVLSGKDLSNQYSPDMRGLAKGILGPVCWSLDGKFLYTGKASWLPFIIRIGPSF
jgi:WD40 repeat protein